MIAVFGIPNGKKYVAHLKYRGESELLFSQLANGPRQNIDQIHFPCADCTNIKLSALYSFTFCSYARSFARLFVFVRSAFKHPFKRSLLITCMRTIEKSEYARNACGEDEEMKRSRTNT